MAKNFLSNLHRHVMNKCWKFQEDILIFVWIIEEWLKICCNQWPPHAQPHQKLASGGHWLQQIFSLLSITQTRIKITSWNFQHLFITCLCKFDKKILAVAQSACQLRPISAKILEVSSNSICWDIWKRKKMVRFWTYLSNLLEGIFNIF